MTDSQGVQYNITEISVLYASGQNMIIDVVYCDIFYDNCIDIGFLLIGTAQYRNIVLLVLDFLFAWKYNLFMVTKSWFSYLPEHLLPSLQDIDIALVSLTISDKRSEVVDFLSPIFDTYFGGIITTRPKSEFFFLEPVHYSVWLLCVCVGLVTAIYLHGFDRFTFSLRSNASNDVPNSLYYTVWMTIGTFLNQGKLYSSPEMSMIL